MRMFLYVILNLIKNTQKENCNVLSDKVNTGIADYLYFKYEHYFVDSSFDKCKLKDINEFYNAERKYKCSNDEGLYLLVAIALNEILYIERIWKNEKFKKII